LEEKIRTSSTKEVAGMFRGTTEAKASHSHNNHQTNKFSTLSSKRIASKDSRCRRQPQAKHHKSSTKEELEQKPRTKTVKAILFLSQRKQRAHHQRLPRCEGNSGEDKKQGKSPTFAITTR
jgi:hypothetical protein